MQLGTQGKESEVLSFFFVLCSETRLNDLLDFGQLFKAFGNN